MNEKKFLRVLDELCPEDCKGGYCFYKMFLKEQHPDIRTLIQLKCIEKFKWHESERENKDIGWGEAGMRWVTTGLAKKFAEVYNEDLSVVEIYTLTTKIPTEKP